MFLARLGFNPTESNMTAGLCYYYVKILVAGLKLRLQLNLLTLRT